MESKGGRSRKARGPELRKKARAQAWSPTRVGSLYVPLLQLAMEGRRAPREAVTENVKANLGEGEDRFGRETQSESGDERGGEPDCNPRNVSSVDGSGGPKERKRSPSALGRP
ncbi:HMG box domain-containing protein [Psidium guajava]|nr:HMG box domain-containing protein [Psidium guajava]